MKFKKNVTVIFNEWALTCFAACDKVWAGLGEVEPTCTSGIEGAHGENSFHYRGLAWDFRMPTIPDKIIPTLKLELGYTYQVIKEGDHIHVEFDPPMRRGL